MVIMSSVIKHNDALVVWLLLQQAFLGEAEFLDVTLCAHARIKRTLQVENRQPTEKEAALLKKYEGDL